MKDYWILSKHEYGQDEFLVAAFSDRGCWDFNSNFTFENNVRV